MLGYYKTLEVPCDADTADIKKSYRKLAFKWHPDKNPNNPDDAYNKFKEITKAYEVLSNNENRFVYDLLIKEGLVNDDFSTSYESLFTFRNPAIVYKEFYIFDNEVIRIPKERTNARSKATNENKITTKDSFKSGKRNNANKSGKNGLKSTKNKKEDPKLIQKYVNENYI